MRIILTKENHDSELKKFEKELLDGTAFIEYNLYLGTQFLTDCRQSNIEDVIEAYKHLGKLTAESVLVCETNE
jgi:hypothetical protein